MTLSNPSARSNFFVGTRGVQSALSRFRPTPLTAEQSGFLEAELAQHGYASAEAPDRKAEPMAQFAQLVIALHAALLREAGFFLPEPAELVECDGQAPLLQIAVPRIPMQQALANSLLMQLIKDCTQSALSSLPIEPWLAVLRGQLAKVEHPGPNIALFARAAHRLGFPVLQWQSHHLQIGFGARSTVLNGSITDKTPNHGVAIAREKSLCNALLAQAGFPVANTARAKNLEEALKIARSFGYPVAVKPSDRDGGVAVSADVRNPQELEQAFALARKASRKVQVESHISGKDFRLLVFNGKLLTAIERTPGGVTGNGKDNVARLLDALNASPDRGPGPDTLLYPVDLDDEARLMLKRQELTLDSVPAAGRFVPLRRAANFALGGSVRLVDDEVHPDNLDLALRAARLLRLDLAGLDLIMPDIGQSWRETGGAICEINAQPFIGDPVLKDFHQLILNELVQDEGRIPLVLAVGRIDGRLLDRLLKEIPGIAIVDSLGARLGGHPVSRAGSNWVQACQAPLFDPDVHAVLCQLDPAGPLPTCAPVDRFSAAFLLDTVPGEAPTISTELAALLKRADAPIAAPAEFARQLAEVGLGHRKLAVDQLELELRAALAPPK